jgi:hypothetical protein
MVQDLVLVVAVLVAAVLGYLLGMAQAREELVPLLPLKSHSEWVVELGLAKAQALVLQSELDSAQVRVQDSELELVRAKARLERVELALEEFRYRSQETDWKDHH